MSSNVHGNRDVLAAPVDLCSYGQDGHMKRPLSGGTFWQWSGKIQGNQILRSRLCLQSDFCLGTAQMLVVKVLTEKAQGPEFRSPAPT